MNLKERVHRLVICAKRLERSAKLDPPEPWYLRRESTILLRRAFSLWWALRLSRQPKKEDTSDGTG